MEILFWFWVVLAALLLVMEIFTAGFFMLPFGVGAIGAAVLEYFDVPIGWQLAFFIVVSGILLVSLRRFADRVTHDSPEAVGIDRMIGKQGMVIDDIDNAANTGRVRVMKEEWRGDSADDSILEIGTRIIVEGVDGTHLVVRSIEQQATAETEE